MPVKQEKALKTLKVKLPKIVTDFLNDGCKSMPKVMKAVEKMEFGRLGSWIEKTKGRAPCGCLVGSVALAFRKEKGLIKDFKIKTSFFTNPNEFDNELNADEALYQMFRAIEPPPFLRKWSEEKITELGYKVNEASVSLEFPWDDGPPRATDYYTPQEIKTLFEVKKDRWHHWIVKKGPWKGFSWETYYKDQVVIQAMKAHIRKQLTKKAK